MDVLTWACWVGAGVVVGVVTGLLPGLHVNTLAALAVLAPPALRGMPGAVALASVGAAHAFVQALPGTYLGAPSDESGLGALPAHRMLLRGRGRHAVRATLDATLGGLVLAVLVAPALAYAVTRWPVGPWLRQAAPWLLAATLALLLASEARKGWRALRWAVVVLVASGALGLVARRLPLQGILAVPASPFLPLLSGMFGLAGLLAAAGGAAWPDPDAPGRPGTLRGLRAGVALGVGASVFTLLVPGLTSASAAAWASVGRRGTEAGQVALLSAVNSAHLALAVVVLATTGDARTGLAMAVADGSGVAAAGVLAPACLLLLAAVVAASLASWRVAALVEMPYARTVRRLGSVGVAWVAGGLLVLACAVLSGLWGLVLLACATLLGLVPVAAGVRRIHLTGALLLPALLDRLA